MSDKSEKPTPKKIRDAREEGQVAKSADLTTGVQLAILLGYFLWRSPEIYAHFGNLIKASIEVINLPLSTASSSLSAAAFDVFIEVMAPIGVLLLVGTIGSVFGQIGIMASLKVIMPKFERVNPLSNFKNLFSLKSVFEFGKSLLKVITLSLVTYVLIRQDMNSFQFLSLCGAECGIFATAKMVFWLWATLLLCYVVFAAADLAYQKHQLMKQLMMSRDEIAKEHKNSEGDPEIKHKRKEVHREIQSGSLESNVKKATALVRNPTHVAVCIYYCAGETPLPQVVEKGAGERALTMVRIAEAANVPMVEHIPLARAMFARLSVGEYVPRDLFEPVAEVLQLVSELEEIGALEAEDGEDAVNAGRATPDSSNPS
ncbi:EscU/YscU/HrcU family type III secretion system export apparatus switch protein [Cupriavidus pampae]|uniref:Yop proteins translocation protein U n=1 Tax=Cupriavidus pampae TaxID=659251 RepID=A0ABN7ZNS4_9BURK|nr:EscU/YscU/HrcU family type III secretion system export apparatus switch protein [Cupriavidus pampae]CAG9185935.1 Yop proteins translocation protein U [Cupriavidus pampae]